MIKVEITFTDVAEAARFFVAASGAAPISALPAIVEPPAPKAQPPRPPTEPKITVPPAEPKVEAGNGAAPAPAPAGAVPTSSPVAVQPASSPPPAGAPFDRKLVSQDMVRLAAKDMGKATALLEAYGAKRQKDLTDAQAAELHPKILAALGA
jgi:hypothetical protein